MKLFLVVENAATPYSALVYISEVQYGSGFGSSKKQAKANAARKALEILIPQMKDKISGNCTGDVTGVTLDRTIKASKGNSDSDLSFFDEIAIEDARVAELCAKTTEPSPHAILVTCLQRNFGLGNMQIKYSVNTLKHQRNEFTMQAGKHEATVVSGFGAFDEIKELLEKEEIESFKIVEICFFFCDRSSKLKTILTKKRIF